MLEERTDGLVERTEPTGEEGGSGRKVHNIFRLNEDAEKTNENNIDKELIKKN